MNLAFSLSLFLILTPVLINFLSNSIPAAFVNKDAIKTIFPSPLPKSKKSMKKEEFYIKNENFR